MTIFINGWQPKFLLLFNQKGSGAEKHRFLFHGLMLHFHHTDDAVLGIEVGRIGIGQGLFKSSPLLAVQVVAQDILGDLIGPAAEGHRIFADQASLDTLAILDSLMRLEKPEPLRFSFTAA